MASVMFADVPISSFPVGAGVGAACSPCSPNINVKMTIMKARIQKTFFWTKKDFFRRNVGEMWEARMARVVWCSLVVDSLETGWERSRNGNSRDHLTQPEGKKEGKKDTKGVASVVGGKYEYGY